MERTKTVEPGHKVVTDGAGGECETALDNLLEPQAPYQTNMAPLAKEAEAPPDGAGDGAEGTETKEAAPMPAPAKKPGAGGKRKDKAGKQLTSADNGADITAAKEQGRCVVVLKNGATYHFRGKVYKNGVPTPVDPDVATRLLRTGLFVKG